MLRAEAVAMAAQPPTAIAIPPQPRRHTHQAQKEDLRSVSEQPGKPIALLNHWRSESTSDTRAIGTWYSESGKDAPVWVHMQGANWHVAQSDEEASTALFIDCNHLARGP